MSKSKKLKVVGLFSGCGGLDLGFIQAGFDIIWANDFNSDAVKTYQEILVIIFHVVILRR